MSENPENKIELPVINLPGDQFAHTDAPTEWWWHVGTLTAEDGRVFGFEVNATGMLSEKISYAFTQIQITDVKNQRNYQKVNPILPRPNDWAQYDTSQPWFVKLGQSGTDGSVSMNAINGNPLNMSVQAIFTDVNSKGVETSCELTLNLFQQGPPLLVWGTGCHEVNPSGTSPITKNNYYYSLTHLQASGTIKIGNEEIKVSGLTWMDHEYGAFPQGSPTSKVIWLLQDIQLENGLHLSNYTKFGVYPEENVPMSSNATLLIDGKSHFIKTTTTPLGPLFVSDKGITYFLKFKIELEGHDQLSFIVDSSYGDQVFRDGEGADVYEGVGTAELIYDLTQKEKIVLSKGTAWIEQNLG